MSMPGVLVDPAVAHGGDRDLAGLAHHLDGVVDDLVVQDPDRDDRVVGQLAPRGLGHELVSLLGRRERVGGAEHPRHLPLELHRVDHHDVLGAREGGALHRVAADAARAVDHHGLPRAHPGGVHRRVTPARLL
jgi:hypothetical protein